jgi:hypothetical protein
MSTLPYSDRLPPLSTDARIEERVSHLIGEAHTRQLWLLFVDGDDMQLPLLLPIGDLPPMPVPEATAVVVNNLGWLMREIGATRLILVWERRGDNTLAADDVAWVSALATACRGARVPLRAMFLAHCYGVRWIAPDDWA